MNIISGRKLQEIQSILKEEQLIIKQYKQDIKQSVQTINSLRLNIPLLVQQTRNKYKVVENTRRSYFSVQFSPFTLTENSKGNHRLFKYSDVDHPFGVQKRNYELIMEFSRTNPHVLAKACKHIISAASKPAPSSSQQTSTSQPASSSSFSFSSLLPSSPRMSKTPSPSATPSSATATAASSISSTQDPRSIASLIVYGIYGNMFNAFEDTCLKNFIKSVLETAFEHHCTEPKDILNNTFVSNLLNMYMTRKGIDFAKYLIHESFMDVILKESFDVRLENLSKKVQENREKAEKIKKKTPPGLVCLPSNGEHVYSPTETLLNMGGVFQGASTTEANAILPSEVDKETLEEQRLRENTANLYRVCNRFVSTLVSNMTSIPKHIQSILRSLYQFASERFPSASYKSRVEICKLCFFKVFLFPLVLDFEKVGIQDSLVLNEHKDKMNVIIRILTKTIFDNTKFEETSAYAPINVFVEQNQQILDDVFLEMVTKEVSKTEEATTSEPTTPMTLFKKQSLKSFFAATKFSPRKSSSSLPTNMPLLTKEIVRARSQVLSPVILSTAEVEMLVQNLEASDALKQKSVPTHIKDAMNDIMSWDFGTKQSKHAAEGQKYVVMCMNEREVNSETPQDLNMLDSKEEKLDLPEDPKTKEIKYLIQQILLSIRYITETSSDDAFMKSLYIREKGNENIVAASAIQELLKKLEHLKQPAQSSSTEHWIYKALAQDINKRKQYGQQIMDKQRCLLREIDELEEQINLLASEKEMLHTLLENHRFRLFIQKTAVDQKFKEFLQEFSKCASIEHQERKLRSSYLEFKTLLQQHFTQTGTLQASQPSSQPTSTLSISQIEFDRHCVKLKRYMLCKVYDLIASPNGTYYSQKDKFFKEKIQQINPFLTPSQLNIKEKYWDHNLSEAAQQILRQMDDMVLPEDKMTCITKCSSLIIELMRLSGDEFPSIDDFLPLLIYCILRTNPPRIYSNLKYITRFQATFSDNSMNLLQHQTATQNGEYWLKHFEAAITFIDDVDIKKLNASGSSQASSPSSNALTPTTSTGNLLDAQSKQKPSLADVHAAAVEVVNSVKSNTMKIFQHLQKSSKNPSQNNDKVELEQESTPDVAKASPSIEATPKLQEESGSESPLRPQQYFASNSAPVSEEEEKQATVLKETEPNPTNQASTPSDSSSLAHVESLQESVGKLENITLSLKLQEEEEKKETVMKKQETSYVSTPGSDDLISGSTTPQHLYDAMSFVNVKLEDLKVTEIPKLLEQYKQLALAHIKNSSKSHET